jgi:hypothetical protein
VTRQDTALPAGELHYDVALAAGLLAQENR